MAEDPSDPDIERSRALLTESDQALREALAAFAILKARIEAEEPVPSLELAKVMSIISQSRGRMTDHMGKHEDRLLFKSKRVAHAPLNFEQLRADIGGKIDRIRRSLRSEGVSDEPEE